MGKLKGISENNLINKFNTSITILVSSLVPILSLPIFTKFLSTEDYGILALANTYEYCLEVCQI